MLEPFRRGCNLRARATPESALTAAPPSACELIATWREAGPRRWFAKDAAFDAALSERFGASHREAAGGRLSHWVETADGALAFVLLTDQLSRHLHRGSALAFATDPLARAAAEQALRRGFDRAAPVELRPFLYMPFEHAEDAATQARSVALFARYAQEAGDPRGFLRHALIHQEVIRRFGRFPHRNAMLGRTPSQAERLFLDGGGFAG